MILSLNSLEKISKERSPLLDCSITTGTKLISYFPFSLCIKITITLYIIYIISQIMNLDEIHLAIYWVYDIITQNFN